MLLKKLAEMDKEMIDAKVDDIADIIKDGVAGLCLVAKSVIMLKKYGSVAISVKKGISSTLEAVKNPKKFFKRGK